MTNILNAVPRPCFSLLLRLLCSQPTTPAPGQTAVLRLLGHWQAGGGGGSFHSCKDPLASESQARQPHEINRPSYLRGAFQGVHYTVCFSGSTPNTALINASCNQDTQTFYLFIAKRFVYFNFQNLLSCCKLQVDLNKKLLQLSKSTAQSYEHDEVYLYRLFRMKYTSSITSGHFNCFVSHSLF